MKVGTAKVTITKCYIEYSIDGGEPRMKFFDTFEGRRAKAMWEELNRPIRRKKENEMFNFKQL